jgi:hypothetical protein
MKSATPKNSTMRLAPSLMSPTTFAKPMILHLDLVGLELVPDFLLEQPRDVEVIEALAGYPD